MPGAPLCNPWALPQAGRGRGGKATHLLILGMKLDPLPPELERETPSLAPVCVGTGGSWGPCPWRRPGLWVLLWGCFTLAVGYRAAGTQVPCPGVAPGTTLLAGKHPSKVGAVSSLSEAK